MPFIDIRHHIKTVKYSIDFTRFLSDLLLKKYSLYSKYVYLYEERELGETMISTSDANFEAEVLQSDIPVLVDFWAEWCGPCKMIAPILEDITADYEGKVKIAKLNIDENPATPPKYGVRGIPTLMLFKNGEVDATQVGALSKSQLTAFLDGNL